MNDTTTLVLTGFNFALGVLCGGFIVKRSFIVWFRVRCCKCDKELLIDPVHRKTINK